VDAAYAWLLLAQLASLLVMQSVTACSTKVTAVRCHLAPKHIFTASKYNFRRTGCCVCKCSNNINGSGPTWEQQQQQQQQQPAADAPVPSAADPSTVPEDPLEAMLYVAQQETGMNVVWADPDDEEDELEDVLDDLEDVWMRNPARECPKERPQQ
jgi:hypothetical protein